MKTSKYSKTTIPLSTNWNGHTTRVIDRNYKNDSMTHTNDKQNFIVTPYNAIDFSRNLKAKTKLLYALRKFLKSTAKMAKVAAITEVIDPLDKSSIEVNVVSEIQTHAIMLANLNSAEIHPSLVKSHSEILLRMLFDVQSSDNGANQFLSLFSGLINKHPDLDYEEKTVEGHYVTAEEAQHYHLTVYLIHNMIEALTIKIAPEGSKLANEGAFSCTNQVNDILNQLYQHANNLSNHPIKRGHVLESTRTISQYIEELKTIQDLVSRLCEEFYKQNRIGWWFATYQLQGYKLEGFDHSNTVKCGISFKAHETNVLLKEWMNTIEKTLTNGTLTVERFIELLQEWQKNPWQYAVEKNR
ncbi:MAG: hypothetical protein AAF518_23545 [Spirochaetota bacterium]